MRIRIALALAASALVILASAGTATAALTVANQNDSGPGSLRQTVAEAGPGETINVPAGTYTLTSAPLVIMKSLNISGAGSATTIIRAGAPDINVLTLIGPLESTTSATISGVTIRDGNIVGNSSFGGGIVSVNANLTLRGVSITGNTANANAPPGLPGGQAEGAGAISIGGEFNLFESSITNNVATAIGGSGAAGGGAAGAGLIVVGPLRIENSTVRGNLADGRGGQGPPDSDQDGGTASGAGIIVINNETAPATIAGSTISGNVADASSGPGGSGGAVAGGGLLDVSNAVPVSVTNTTVAGNVARSPGAGSEPGAGGGILTVANAAGSFSFLSTTISGNRLETANPTSLGGNLFSTGAGASTFRNTIVANGAGATGSENCAVGPGVSVTSLGFNIDSLDQCNFKAPGDLFNTDPLLGPLALNGGPTQTMAPAIGSPAIDKGSAFGLSADQRGIVRPIDLPSIPNSAAAGADGSDIGAVELQPSNAFSLGKLTRNKKKGTATLAVLLPQPSAGTLTLTGKGLKTQTLQIAGESEVKVKVAAKSKAIKKALRRRGKRKVGINVTYAPTGNSAATQSRKAKLVKKKKRKKKRAGSGTR